MKNTARPCVDAAAVVVSWSYFTRARMPTFVPYARWST